MKKLQIIGAVALVIAGGAFCVPSAMAGGAKDNFNRSTLGAKWVVPSGTLTIVNNQLQGSSLAIGYYKKSAKSTAVSAKVQSTSTDLEYGAVAVGDVASGNNAFIKIQGSGDGGFQQAGFYTGDNIALDFFSLTSEVPSPAKISAAFCGTVATLTITSSAPTQKYSFDYGTSFGSGGGLGTYGSVALDNYKSTKKDSCTADRDAIRITRSNAVDPTVNK